MKYSIGKKVVFMSGSSENPRAELCVITDIIKDDDGNYLYQINNFDYLYDFELEDYDDRFNHSYSLACIVDGQVYSHNAIVDESMFTEKEWIKLFNGEEVSTDRFGLCFLENEEDQEEE